MSERLEVREMKVAEVTGRTFKGIAVPYNVDAVIGDFRERIAPGAVVDYDTKIFWRHSDPIGRIVSARDTEDGTGWEIEGLLSETPRGQEAATLLRDGVIDALSIGFVPRESARDGNVTVRKKISVKEVSLVPHAAYDQARLSEVRENQEHVSAAAGSHMSTITAETEIAELRNDIEDLTRSLALIGTSREPEGEQFRSYGEFVKAAVAGDERAIALNNRAWDGTTSGDGITRDQWYGSLVRLLDGKQPVKNSFTRGPLPARGMGVEYAVLESDTTQVAQQVNEGDDLVFGKVAIDIERAGIKTFGGWSSLSRQAIERTENVNILDTTWTALAIKAARAEEDNVRRVVLDRVTSLAPVVTGGLTDAGTVLDLLLDLQEVFDDRERTLDGLFVSRDVFRTLAGIPEEPTILQVSGAAPDKLGVLSVGSITAGLAGIPVRVFPGLTNETGLVFAYDSFAVKSLSAGGPTRLQDDNVVNLTRDVSVYFYGASFVQAEDGLAVVSL